MEFLCKTNEATLQYALGSFPFPLCQTSDVSFIGGKVAS